MWDLPGPGIEPVSPALAGKFLTTAPPGKSPSSFLGKPISNLTGLQKSYLQLLRYVCVCSSSFTDLKAERPTTDIKLWRGLGITQSTENALALDEKKQFMSGLESTLAYFGC